MAGAEGVATMNPTGRTNMAAPGPRAGGARPGLSFGDWLPPHGPGQLCPLVLALGVHGRLIVPLSPVSAHGPAVQTSDRSGLQQDLQLRATTQSSVTVSWDGHA